MKKKLLITLVLFTMSTLIGCSGESLPPKSEEVTQSESTISGTAQILTYSLMSDESSQTEIKQLMLKNNIPLENIETFFKSVNQFNELMGNMKGNTVGFEMVSYPAELFDYDFIGTTWFKELKFDDQQCRLTAFNLLKDIMDIPSELMADDPNFSLNGDLEIQKTNPNVSFTQEELTKFKNLFIDVPTNGETDTKALAEVIGEEWRRRGISFNKKVKASLMSLFINSAQDSVVFVGHAGIVLESADGYVLVEKLGQYAPYVASKFSTLDEMKAYLLSAYEVEGLMDGLEPFVFLDDTLL